MSLFSFGTETDRSNKKGDIPQEFYDAVSVMEDVPFGKFEKQPVTTSQISQAEKLADGASPFLDAFPSKKEAAAEGTITFQPSSEDTQPIDVPSELVFSDEIDKNTRFSEPETKSDFSSPKKHTATLIIAISSIAIVCIALAYYFFSYRPTHQQPEMSTFSEVSESTSSEVQSETASTMPFATDTPNYLPIDTETATAESVRAAFLQISTQMADAGMDQPVEFFVTDNNNNPIAFSRFAYMTGIALPADFLALSNETFSFCVYNDGGQMRFVLDLSFKDAATAEKLITSNESGLPAAFQKLFYGTEVIAPNAAIFRSGAYGSSVIRYVNLDIDRHYSLDYVIENGEMIISSSKDALRAFLAVRQSK